MKNQGWKFWAVWIGLLLVGYWIWTRIAKTGSDAGTAADNLYFDPIKQLFGSN